jgi:hypothetical protein
MNIITNTEGKSFPSSPRYISLILIISFHTA